MYTRNGYRSLGALGSGTIRGMNGRAQIRESQLDLIKSAMTVRGWRRHVLLRAAGAEVSPPILERMRAIVRAEITHDDEDRPHAKGRS
jgi:hypothetical protein